MCDSGTDASSLVAQLEQEVFALRIELLTIRGDLVFAEQSLSGDSGEGNGKAQGELEATMSAVADARGMLWTAGGGAAPGQKTSGFSSEEKHGQQAEQVAEVAAGTVRNRLRSAGVSETFNSC